MCIEYFNKAIKKMKVWDVSLVKLSVAAFVLFIVSLLPLNAISWIVGMKWLWLILFIAFAIKPMIKVFSK